jgi:peroxiredoxin Q/BCP
MRLTMRRLTVSGILGGCLLISAVARSDEKVVKVGALAPEFSCEDDNGNVWQSRDHVGKKIIVLYFYPSDFAFCCTRQANLYRDHQANFVMLNAEVIGISGDGVQAHREFKETNKLSQTLLADSHGTVASQFEVPLRNGGKATAKSATFPRAVTAARQTFVIGLDGRIKYHAIDVSPIKDSEEVLDCVCNLQ